MTDHIDDDRHDPGPEDDRQARLLDAFLDSLRTDNRPAPPGLDADLARMARLTHDLGGTTDSPMTPPATPRAVKAQTWEKLMQPAMPPSILAFPVRHDRTGSPRVLAGPPDHPIGAVSQPPNPVASGAAGTRSEPSRLRRLGHRSLGLVATLTLIALVALSAFAVYLSAPPPSPTIMLAGMGGGTPGVPRTDGVLLPNRTTCSISPRDQDQTMALLEPYLSGRLAPPAPTLGPHQVPGQAELPPGMAPDAATTAAIATVWGTYQGCQLSREYRRSASLFTDDGLVRYYATGKGEPLNDHDIALLAYEPVADDALPRLDDSSTRAITDLRLIGDDRAAAFVSTGWTDAATSPAANDPRRQFGHIVFVRDGDRWLIDELIWWEFGEG